MTKEKKERLFIFGGLAIALIEVIVIGTILIVNALGSGKAPAVTPTTPVTTVTEATTVVTEPPLPMNGFSPEDFLMVDGFMTCTAADYMIGIDVSSHQGVIDWKQVKEAGVQFVIIRLGGRGYGEEGNLFRDDMAQRNYEGAKENGLLVGGYIFSQALNEEEAVEEAQLALEMTQGWELDLPIAFDWEFLHFEARTDEMYDGPITDCAIAFCETLKAAGVQPMLYTGLYVKTLRLEEVLDYPMWLALYTDTMSYDYWMSFWQYSCTGKVPGINTDVDLNIYLPNQYPFSTQ